LYLWLSKFDDFSKVSKLQSFLSLYSRDFSEKTKSFLAIEFLALMGTASFSFFFFKKRKRYSGQQEIAQKKRYLITEISF
jgi:asparagine N-glycosylation enzyme membrane subunit Stt3